MQQVWDIIQNQILGMKWLNELLGNLLNACGLDTAGLIGGSIRFFIYDTIKIFVLLGFLIFIISYIQSFFPPERTKRILGGNNPFGVILAAIAGIPMYADIFGTIPIAEALLVKGALLGVVLSFMMGVTTLSLPSVIMLRKAVKPKLLGIFISICILGIILVGYLFNIIQPLIIISGCASCHRQYEYAKEAVKNMEIPVEVEYITDLAKVMEYGVMSMPALVVNEKVAAMGKVLKPSEIEKLLHKLGF